jgi:hypothetical protein
LCRYGKGRCRYVPGELGLKDHQASASIAKSYFADGEIKLPHATKPLVVDPRELRLSGQEVLTPKTKRFRVVQPQNFEVGQPEPRALDDRKDLGKSGDENSAFAFNLQRPKGVIALEVMIRNPAR